jgi:lysophospholipid acyltransferase (LPLAT)-like uncharacterized protein
MSKKWKIFGFQTNLEWYDIKTKLKQLLRKLAYSWIVQQLICYIFASYMRLVYATSHVIFINHEVILEAAKNKKPLLISFWHNRLMMIPFITQKPKRIAKNYNFMTLASRHGDGRFVGRVMEKFGLISILGSSKDGRKSSRGIDFSSMRKILDGLKNGYSLGITPDGPRGPNQKINGEIVNIARISGAGIIPTSYSCSKFKQLKTWDNFKIPLPFSTLCFYFDEAAIYVPRNTSESEIEKIKITVEEKMNFVQEKSQELANRKTRRAF